MPRQLTHRVQIPGRKIYSPEWIQEHPEIWQRFIRELHDAGVNAHCKCPGEGSKELIPCLIGDTYFLKKAPHTGPDHDYECAFHQIRIETCGLKAYDERVITIRDDGGLSIRLEVGLLRLNPTENKSEDSAPRPSGHSRHSKPAMTLLGLMHLLWQQARFNLWRPGMRGKRVGTALSAKVRDAALDITASRHRLTDFLVMLAPGDSPKSLYPTVLQNQGVLKKAIKEKRRVLLLGEINPGALNRDEEAIFLHQHHYKVRARFGGNAIEFLDLQLGGQLHAIETSELGSMPRLMVLAVATPRAGTIVTFADVEVCSGMLTTPDYVPIESSHEWRLALHLVELERSFVKPLRFDASLDEVLPDFILLDTDMRQCPLEVYGMATKEYEERRREKEAYYSATFGLRGWWSWDALQEQAIPELPPKTVKTRPIEVAP